MVRRKDMGKLQDEFIELRISEELEGGKQMTASEIAKSIGYHKKKVWPLCRAMVNRGELKGPRSGFFELS